MKDENIVIYIYNFVSKKKKISFLKRKYFFIAHTDKKSCLSDEKKFSF